uniref:RecF/RecN/SMC N-terminal domain-containing protein n=1 Tax=Ditylenchus dipsaci TaxID=166011 RepID=A0A915DVB2_9BILA
MKSNAPSRRSGKRTHTSGEDEYRRLREEASSQFSQVPQIPGKLISVELTNFMCHSTMKLVFDANKNNCYYIIGANGSGKSAIFSGINIGLGGRGRANDRGNTVQSYIKEGKDTAKTRVVLSNGGRNAHPNYGPEIIVERNITPSATTYCLKSRDKEGAVERVVSRKKIDLDRLLQRFNIELDNPLSWLSQDRARQFLQEMKPEKLYEIFTMSTELEATETLYRTIATHLTEMEYQLKICDKKKASMQKDFDALVERFKAGRKIVENKRTYSHLQWKLLWSKIKDVDMQMGKHDEMVTHCRNLKTKLERNVEKYRADQAKEDFEKSNQEFYRNRLTEKLKSNIRTAEREVKQTNDQLARVLGDSNRDVEAEENQLLVQKSRVMQTLTELEDARKQLLEREKLTEECFYAKLDEFEKSRSYVQALTSEIEKIGRDRQTYQAAQKDRYALLGQEIPALINLVRQNKDRFQKIPFGPIGAYVKLRDGKWAAPVEFCLKGLLNNFVCHSAEDRKQLEQLCRANRIKPPPIITYRYTEEKYDVNDNEPDSNFSTVLRVIEVQNATIHNVLLDQANIENRLLIETDEEARRIMREHPPKNAKQALTINCGQAYPKLSVRENYRFYANRFDARFLAKDFQLTARDFQAEHSQLACDLERRKEILARLAEEKSSAEAAKQKVKNEILALQQEVAKFISQKKANEEKLQELQKVISSGDLIQNFKKTLEENTQILEKHLTDMEKHAQQIKDKERESQLIKVRMAEIHEEMKSFKDKHQSIEDEKERDEQLIAQYQNCIEKESGKFERIDRRINETEDKKESLNKDRARFEEECFASKDDNLRCQKPPELTDPPDMHMIPSLEEVVEEIATVDAQIRAAEENMNSTKLVKREDIVKFKETKKRFLVRLNFFRNIYNRLSQLMEDRQAKFHLLMFALPRTLSKSFVEQMGMRGYHGSLNGLSGGERSYTTACFVMALWKCVESPFRCLDEFDVFMDMLNRKMVMEMLVEFAVEHKSNQFFFFTPQGVNELKDRDNIEIFEIQKSANS